MPPPASIAVGKRASVSLQPETRWTGDLENEPTQRHPRSDADAAQTQFDSEVDDSAEVVLPEELSEEALEPSWPEADEIEAEATRIHPTTDPTKLTRLPSSVAPAASPMTPPIFQQPPPMIDPRERDPVYRLYQRCLQELERRGLKDKIKLTPKSLLQTALLLTMCLYLGYRLWQRFGPAPKPSLVVESSRASSNPSDAILAAPIKAHGENVQRSEPPQAQPLPGNTKSPPKASHRQRRESEQPQISPSEHHLTLEKEAVAKLATGREAEALIAYAELARQHPDFQAYTTVTDILIKRFRAHCAEEQHTDDDKCRALQTINQRDERPKIPAPLEGS